MKTNMHPSLRKFLSEKLSALWKNPKRNFLGVKDIPVDQIVGASTRREEFAHKFRPFSRYFQNRSIVVHKVGERYLVKNGHYRVSMARFMGKRFIRAKVWEDQVPQKRTVSCEQIECCEESRTKKMRIPGSI